MRSSPDTSEALDSSPASASRAPRERLIRAAVGAAILVALAWFIVPVFGGSYTEGFEATIAINAREIVAGRVDRVDLLYPFSGRFFLVTRLGSEVVLGAVGAATGFSGLVSFRLVMFASLLVLVGSIVHVLARRYRVHPLRGAYVGHMECHVGPDFLLIWYYAGEDEIVFVRTGSHADLFG